MVTGFNFTVRVRGRGAVAHTHARYDAAAALREAGTPPSVPLANLPGVAGVFGVGPSGAAFCFPWVVGAHDWQAGLASPPPGARCSGVRASRLRGFPAGAPGGCLPRGRQGSSAARAGLPAGAVLGLCLRPGEAVAARSGVGPQSRNGRTPHTHARPSSTRHGTGAARSVRRMRTYADLCGLRNHITAQHSTGAARSQHAHAHPARVPVRSGPWGLKSKALRRLPCRRAWPRPTPRT